MSHDHNVHIEETQDAEMLMTLNHEVQQCHVEMFPHIFKPPVAEEILDFFRKMVADNTFKHLPASYEWTSKREGKIHSSTLPAVYMCAKYACCPSIGEPE